MNKIYFTSDLHFGHDKPFLYEPRGFSEILANDLRIVENWNRIVDDSDKVYILGDVMLNDNNWGAFLLTKLKGEKHIILGNHDTETKIKVYNKLGIDCKYVDILRYKKYKLYLSHYPTFTGNNSKKISQTLINLYGHTHQKENFYHDNWFMYHVGVDSHNCYPVEIEDIIKDIKEKIGVENVKQEG